MNANQLAVVIIAGAAWLLTVACSGSKGDSEDAGQGGVTSTGGSSAGGGTVASGGRVGTGGAVSLGGRVGTGGAVSLGGRVGTGGVLASGGAAGGGPVSSGGSIGTGGATSTPPAGLLDPDYTTAWHPGILSDGQLNQPLGSDGLPVRTTICASPQPGDDLNAAIKACPEGQVVMLAAGTYTVKSTVVLDKGVVLRGAGSLGAANGGTTIVKSGGETALAIGSAYDQTCYSSNYNTAYALTADAVKETATVTLGSNASKFAAGDLVLVDQVDDATVDEGDCQYFKRVDKRSVSQRAEVASVDAAGGTVTLTSPLHFTFKAASPYLA
ncbi:MAG: hypothetical protein JXP73_20455, partial [Deltaproteobacteria bacterium]|nr:hypothetical protein [Deltaproteobacteria bacterium]